MPFYEYQCKNCGHALEAMQKVSDAPLKKCPECAKSQLVRLMSAPVFRLKGGGWYETDFKGDSDKQRNLADKPDADAPKPDKADTKAEAKGGEEGKGGETKAGDAKGGETKSGDSKPEAGTAKDAKGSNGTAAGKPADKSVKASGSASRGRRGSTKPVARRSAKRPVKAKRRR